VSNTAIPTVSAIVTVGATPVFVDINPKTHLMDVTKLEAAITEKTKCILPVHLFGQCVDMNSVLE
jgi:aminotransferase EvaB